MSNVKYVEKKLSELFFCVSGNNKYTKSYCNAHSGIYEVFTGSTIQTFASLNTYDYDEPNLTFSTDGEYAGTLKVLEGKYNIGGHRKILIKKDKNLDLYYFAILLQPMFYKHVKRGDVPSVNWKEQLANIVVRVPIDEDGNYDLNKQQEIALKYQNIIKIKKDLLDKMQQILNVQIELNTDLDKYTTVEFNKMFLLKRGKIISKEDVQKNKGSYPVYSTQKDVFGYVNFFMNDGNFLLWNTDGLAGYIKIVNGRFSYTNIVGIMLPTKVYDMSNISLNYLKFYLEPIFRNHRKGRLNINNKNEYTKLNSTMIKTLDIRIPIPIDDLGNFDLKKQEKIAQKYIAIENIKKNLYAKLKELISVEILDS